MGLPAPSERLYFRQLLSGRDFAESDPLARQMANFAYLIGDRATGDAMVVDPAHAPGELADIVAADGMRLTGALVTHYHPDHCGGEMMGLAVAGIAALLERAEVPIHVQRDEVPWVERTTGVDDALVAHDPGDVVSAGAVEVELIHTPGHTPGSQCFLVRAGATPARLVAGDTLFLEGCGRTDLPGGDAEALYHSLHHRLAKVPDDAVVYPGHLYAPQGSAPMGQVRRDNLVFRPKTAAEWLALFGG